MHIENQANVNFASVHPIDTLLVQQLEDILKGEKALHRRYAALDPDSSSPDLRRQLSRELASLQERADRLCRLIDAMNYPTPAVI